MSRILLIADGMTDAGFRVADYPALSAMEELEPEDYAGADPPETFTCVLRILGVRQIPPHLRPIAEAYGAGLEVRPDDLWLRASWYHLDDEGRPDRQEDFPSPLPEEEYDIGRGHRLLRFPGGRDRAQGLRLPRPFLSDSADWLPRGDSGIRALLARRSAPGHRLIAWDYGVVSPLPHTEEKGVLIASEPVLLGIGRLLGLPARTDPRLTGDTDTDLGLLRRMIEEEAAHYPLVVAHLNGADQASHRLDPEGKRAFLRRVDRLLAAPLLAGPHSLLVTSDHG